MAQAINTDFDQAIESDVLLEQIDGKAPGIQVTLKNSENIYKSFLYLRKMYSTFPATKSILSMNTVSYAASTAIVVPDSGNLLLVNNFSASNAEISINGDVYTMQPAEKIELPLIAPDSTSNPVVSGDAVELKGDVSYIVYNNQEV